MISGKGAVGAQHDASKAYPGDCKNTRNGGTIQVKKGMSSTCHSASYCRRAAAVSHSLFGSIHKPGRTHNLLKEPAFQWRELCYIIGKVQIRKLEVWHLSAVPCKT